MRALSKDAEQKLIAAIEKAAELVNSGTEPNAAIIKSATDANIPAGHINLMVHAYNTGRTNKQREHGENTHEKAADFHLADADVVLNALYPQHVKTSSALEREAVVSTEYAVSPRGFLTRRQRALEKAAAAARPLPEKTFVPAPRDEKAAAERAYTQKVAAQREAEETRRVKTIAYHKAAGAMDELYEYFRRPGNMSFGDALVEVDLRLGASGVNVLNKLAGIYPHLEKQAATHKPHFGAAGPHSLVNNVLDALEAYNSARVKAAAHEKTIASLAEMPEPLTGSILHDPKKESLTLKEAANAPDKKKDSSPPLTSFSNTLGSIGGMMSGATKQLVGADQKPGDEKSKAFMNITSPEHENRLQQVRARGVLNDLIINDSVISGYDPHEVAVAYNQLAELAPNFTSSPAAMQAMLRKRLEAGQLADFDVKQILDMEKTRADSVKSHLEAQDAARKLV
jgi:hypothetical protein